MMEREVPEREVADPARTDPHALGKIVVVTPTYNEVDNLEAFVERLFQFVPSADLLVVDDASPDGTGDLADHLSQVDSRIHVVHRPAKLGLGSAYRDGFRWALDRRYDVVIEMDTDLSHDARHVRSMFLALDQGADVVVGSRAIPGGGVVGWGLLRHALSRSGSAYARAILSSNVRDLTTGFKAYTRHALETIHPDSLTSNGYAFQIETTHRAECAGLKVVEVPIVFVDRRVGQSKMSSRIVIEAVFAVFRLRRQYPRSALP
jgi:dolichol-phosphate mannosyltransferase